MELVCIRMGPNAMDIETDINIFKALTDVRALKFHTCTQNIGLKPPFTGSYLFQELDPDGSRFLKGGTTP